MQELHFTWEWLIRFVSAERTLQRTPYCSVIMKKQTGKGCSSSVNAQTGLYSLCSLAWPEALRTENARAACCWTGICKSSLKFLRDSSPETNTGPHLVYEKFEFGIFHCPCSLLGVSDGRAISDKYRTQTVRFRSYLLPVLLTLLNWSALKAVWLIGRTGIDDLALPVMELKARDRVRLVFSFYDD